MDAGDLQRAFRPASGPGVHPHLSDNVEQISRMRLGKSLAVAVATIAIGVSAGPNDDLDTLSHMIDKVCPSGARRADRSDKPAPDAFPGGAIRRQRPPKQMVSYSRRVSPRYG